MLQIAGGILLAILALPVLGLLLYIAFWIAAAPFFGIAFLIRWMTK